MELAECLFVFASSYLLGSLNVSLLLSCRMAGGDVRGMGSGNAGATNMARSYGLNAGLLTLAGDMLKGVAAMLGGFLLLGDTGIMLGGMGCILGHCFPVLYSFRGGKGVAVGAAIALCTDWRAAPAVLAVFFLTAFATKKVSLSSLCAAVMLCAVLLFLDASPQRLTLALFAAVLIIIRHRGNIVRLLRGTEPDFHINR